MKIKNFFRQYKRIIPFFSILLIFMCSVFFGIGYFIGADSQKVASYNAGYDIGYDSGYNLGYDLGYSVAELKAEGEALKEDIDKLIKS